MMVKERIKMIRRLASLAVLLFSGMITTPSSSGHKIKSLGEQIVVMRDSIHKATINDPILLL
jgi:hypothetical protein